MLMYTPNPLQSGSSVSYWDISAFPNQPMEPAINGDLTHEVTPPRDLTFRLLQDIGWSSRPRFREAEGRGDTAALFMDITAVPAPPRTARRWA